MTRLAQRCLKLLLAGLALSMPAAFAAIPASWQASSVLDAVSVGSSPTDRFRISLTDQVLSVGTHVNSNNALVGYWLKGNGEFHSYSIKFGPNSQMVSLDTTNFVALAGSGTSCWSSWLFPLFCNNYGIRVIPPVASDTQTTGISAYINSPTDAAIAGGSLPFTMYPGNFVDENDAGIVASTQVTATGQYGVIAHANGVATLADVPWLLAINDIAEPLVLGYDGVEGDCLVYGEGCALPQDCDTDGIDDHDNENGRGHEEHGRGYGYGHDKCSDGSPDGNVGSGNNGSTGTGGGATDTVNRSLLIRLLSDGSTVRYRFPSTVAVNGATLAHAFPVGINNNRAVLRGDVTIGSTTLTRRLLSCRLDTGALDANADGIVDCVGGLEVFGGVDGSIRVGTVLGAKLTDAGLFVGNHGFSTAGIGSPWVVDLNAATPVAITLANLATNTDGWELNEVTDANANHLLTGYGYRDCGSAPQAIVLTASNVAPATALQFVRGAFESPAWLANDDVLDIAPSVTGATGNVEFRTWQRKPTDTAWALLQDWGAGAGQYDPAGYTGEVCFKVEARDSANPAAVQQEVVRYLVTVPPTPDTPVDTGGDTPGDTGSALAAVTPATGDFRIGDLLGAGGGALLVLLMPLALRRRRQLP